MNYRAFPFGRQVLTEDEKRLLRHLLRQHCMDLQLATPVNTDLPDDWHLAQRMLAELTS